MVSESVILYLGDVFYKYQFIYKYEVGCDLLRKWGHFDFLKTVKRKSEKKEDKTRIEIVRIVHKRYACHAVMV